MVKIIKNLNRLVYLVGGYTVYNQLKIVYKAYSTQDGFHRAKSIPDYVYKSGGSVHKNLHRYASQSG